MTPFQSEKMLFSLFSFFLFLFCEGDAQSYPQSEFERPAVTITENDFQYLVQQREKGLMGLDHNIESSPIVPATEKSVFNWSDLPEEEISRLRQKQEEMFRQGKITLIVMAGGEATRFGNPKPFVEVSHELGEFLEIKAANVYWMQENYGTKVPMYILASEKRLQEFKTALNQRQYYGFDSNLFRWFVQGTVDTFIPSDAELKVMYNGDELKTQCGFASAHRKLNPDGIYRFNGECRKIPPGHFDTIAAFIISGRFSEALALGIEYAPIVNIDNLQAILKNDGMIAYFAEKGDDFGIILTEKNLYFKIIDKKKKKIIQDNLRVRFFDNILSFDGLHEHSKESEKDGYRYILNKGKKTIDVYEMETGELVETEIIIKPEIGGTLVQYLNEKGEVTGQAIMKEGFELPAHFNHAQTPFFNTNTIILNLQSLLKFLGISQDQLAKLDFEERTTLVQEKLIKQVKPNFELKTHEVSGEYPNLGIVKEGKTKILVAQVTRIMLQVTHLNQAKVCYIFAPRATVFAPVKEIDDKNRAAEQNLESLKKFTLRKLRNH